MNAGTTLTGTYLIAVGQPATDLGVRPVVGSSIRDHAGNEARNTASGIGLPAVRTAGRR